MCQFNPTDRSRVRLSPGLANYDTKFIYSVIDEVPICHVSTVIDGTPYIQATAHWRIDNKVYLHGAVKNKVVKAVNNGVEACLSFTDFGGFILARSAFNHAVVYRSVTAFCQGRVLEDLAEKNAVLKTFIEHIQPGRWAQIRQPTTNELKRTGVIEFELTEVSAKRLLHEAAAEVLPGGAMEVDDDEKFSPWTGILPYQLSKESPLASTEIAACKASAKTSP